MDRGTVAKKSRKRRNSNTDNTSQQAEKEPVFFSNDTILEAVKFLNYVKWTKMRFLCYRVNQLIHSNQSKLQAFEVKSLSMYSIVRSSNSIVSFDQAIQSPDAVRKWFQDRGYSCDETVDMPLNKVFAGMNNGLHFTIRAFYEEYREKNMPLTRAEAKRTGKLPKMDRCLSNLRAPQVFSAKINDKHEFYGPILYHLFRLLHHPNAYFREVSMFPPMTDKFCDMTVHSPIKCNQFTLLVNHSSLSYSSLEHSLKWLKDNVRAQQIILSFNIRVAIPVSDLHSLILEFILQDASICAQDRIKLDSIPQPNKFIDALIKKYQTLEVTKAIPSIVLKTSWQRFVNPNLVPQHYLYDKYCDNYDIKTYELQNKTDVNRKMIAQYWYRYSNYTVYVKFE
ncbi:hypothetical protein Ddc_16132 [Ditylenchus destructor]|nr:hypothetical protein Ddc_16132 [Ditylenchus destructor]